MPRVNRVFSFLSPVCDNRNTAMNLDWESFCTRPARARNEDRFSNDKCFRTGNTPLQTINQTINSFISDDMVHTLKRSKKVNRQADRNKQCRQTQNKKEKKTLIKTRQYMQATKLLWTLLQQSCTYCYIILWWTICFFWLFVSLLVLIFLFLWCCQTVCLFHETTFSLYYDRSDLPITL